MGWAEDCCLGRTEALTECFSVLLTGFPPFWGVRVLVPDCQGFLPLPGLVGGGMVEFLGDLLGGLAADSRGETGVSIPALTGDWSAFTARKSLAPVLGGWMTDMSPTKGRLRVLVWSTSMGSS